MAVLLRSGAGVPPHETYEAACASPSAVGLVNDSRVLRDRAACARKRRVHPSAALPQAEQNRARFAWIAPQP